MTEQPVPTPSASVPASGSAPQPKPVPGSAEWEAELAARNQAHRDGMPAVRPAMTALRTLDLFGYKSIRELQSFQFGPLNVLIGANGAGKSNLISFFRLLAWAMPVPGSLQLHVQRAGGASSLLFEGPATTPQLRAHLVFDTEQGTNEYAIRLFHGASDTLVFAEEKYRFRRNGHPERPWIDLGAGQKEARIIEEAQKGDQTAKTIHWLLRQCVVHQFHNTSETARMRQRWSADDNTFLKEDAANLAPFLLRLREQKPTAYTRIVDTIRQLAPFFADFELIPENGTMLLRWRERGTDVTFGPHQASDGTLRLMALIALLLQPVETLPAVILLDEPELGLHPFAINIVAGLLRSASHHTQLIVSTQSPMLVDNLEPHQVVVVDRPGRDSQFRRLDDNELTSWLKDYSLGELWEKNVLGGQPA